MLINLEDLNDITDTVKRVQSEKAYSLDNLYNMDDTIQKRKIANINLISIRMNSYKFFNLFLRFFFMYKFHHKILIYKKRNLSIFKLLTKYS